MRIAICDDEQDQLDCYAKKIRLLADKNNINVEIVCYSSGRQLLFHAEDEAQRPDLVFLDVNMPEQKGTLVAKALRDQKIDCELIFLTVSKGHMLDAFDVDALHYIVKQEITDEKFEQVFLKACRRAMKKRQESITISCAGESRVIPLEDIRFFEVRNYIITVHYRDEQFEFYSTLGKVENTLTGRDFLRVHRSFLIAIKEINKITRQEVVLLGGRKIPIGRSYVKSIRQTLEMNNSGRNYSI